MYKIALNLNSNHIPIFTLTLKKIKQNAETTLISFIIDNCGWWYCFLEKAQANCQQRNNIVGYLGREID